MKSFTTPFTVISIASLVISVTARPWTGGASNALARRQDTTGLPTFPPQCDTQCAATTAATEQCLDDSCFCTATNMNNLKTCFQCVANLIDDTADVQLVLNQVTGNCTAEGFPVPSETLTGGSSGGGGVTGGGATGGLPAPTPSDGGIFATTTPLSGASPSANIPAQSSKPIFSAPSANNQSPASQTSAAPLSGGTTLPPVASSATSIISHLPQGFGLMMAGMLFLVL